MRDPTDFELLDAWAAGDKQAATTLFNRHFDAVYRFFRNKSDGNIEDLTQDTFVACIEGRDRFRRDASFRTFLFAIARNVLLHSFRKRRVAAEPFDSEGIALSELIGSPSHVVARKQEQRVLLEALRNLPLDHQIALELYHWEELSGPELARVLGLTEPALRSRLHRAKLQLRQQVERITASGDVLQSTLGDLDRWARSLRELLDAANTG
jgi:RNA polymerase sigma factor (sigma-70 family)